MAVDKSNSRFDFCRMKKIAEIAKAFGSQLAMADAVGVKRGAVEQWCQRNRIPARQFLSVVSAAKSRNINLTTDCLAKIVADSYSDGHAHGEPRHAG